MDIRKRLFRRPVTTVFWLLLIGAMTLLVGVGGALMYASGALAEILDRHFTSIAVRTDAARMEVMTEHGTRRQSEEKLFTQEDRDWFLSLDSVEGIYFHTLSAATSPVFRPLVTNSTMDFTNRSYEQAAVLGTVTRILGCEPYMNPEHESALDDIRIRLTGILEVEEILSQNPNYTRQKDNGAGQEIVFEMVLLSQEGAAYIREGQRYLLMAQYNFAFAGGQLFDGTEVPAVGDAMSNNDTYGAVLTDRGLVRGITFNQNTAPENPEDQIPVMLRVDGTLEECLSRPENQHWAIWLENHRKHNQAVPVIGTEALETFHQFVNYDATLTQGRFFTQEEYEQGAKVCILSEALAVSSGLALGDTITLSQYLCLDPDPYGFYNQSVNVQDGDGRMNNPDVGPITRREFAPEEEFTVVGLYRQKSQWDESSYAVTPNTVFIPQKAQIAGAFGGMSRLDVEKPEDVYGQGAYNQNNLRTGGTFGIYFTMKLKNGMVEDFRTTLEGSPYQGQFLTVEQGADAVRKTLEEVSGSARTLFLAVTLGWVLMAALFVLLYQGRQRRNLGIMGSLGATPKQTRRYLWGSGMAVCGLGIAAGTVVTALTMNLVQNKLLDATFGVEANRYSVAGLSEDLVNLMVTESQFPLWAILAVGAAQLLVLGGILYLQAGAMSRKPPRELLGK